MSGNSFETFGPPHVAVMALTAAAAAGLPVWARRARSAKLTRGICWAIAVVLLANEFVSYGCGLAAGPAADFIRNSLPLHICTTAAFLVAYTLWKRNQYVYEIAYFWALAGTLNAIITPNLSAGFPSYWFFEFFITHCGIVVGVLFATFGLGMRPARGAVLRVFVVTNLYMAVVAGANWSLGANYMFLREPPAGASPFFFLPWPWYILFLEAVGLAFALLLYMPFAISNRFRRHCSKVHHCS
ncbi:MAG: TIGR02206 family membrane protein [Phycisphaerae bacterium]|nr:TIGR02206 family membrane protein [Phycisphaerae bacterium]